MSCEDNTPWRTLIRDLVVDLQKGLLLQNKGKRKFPRSKLKVREYTEQNTSQIENCVLCKITK